MNLMKKKNGINQNSPRSDDILINFSYIHIWDLCSFYFNGQSHHMYQKRKIIKLSIYLSDKQQNYTDIQIQDRNQSFCSLCLVDHLGQAEA